MKPIPVVSYSVSGYKFHGNNENENEKSTLNLAEGKLRCDCLSLHYKTVNNFSKLQIL